MMYGVVKGTRHLYIFGRGRALHTRKGETEGEVHRKGLRKLTKQRPCICTNFGGKGHVSIDDLRWGLRHKRGNQGGEKERSMRGIVGRWRANVIAGGI